MGCFDGLPYANRIWENARFRALMRRIGELERDRIYCRHGITHALDVCRIAWILYLEHYAGADAAFADPGERDAAHQTLPAAPLLSVKDHIYCIGLLHDTGRETQYDTGENHAQAGARIAGEILLQIGYPADAARDAQRIIGAHCGRLPAETFQTMLPDADGIKCCIHMADQLSRNCSFCPVSDTCKWSEDEKITAIHV